MRVLKPGIGFPLHSYAAQHLLTAHRCKHDHMPLIRRAPWCHLHWNPTYGWWKGGCWGVGGGWSDHEWESRNIPSEWEPFIGVRYRLLQICIIFYCIFTLISTQHNSSMAVALLFVYNTRPWIQYVIQSMGWINWPVSIIVPFLVCVVLGNYWPTLFVQLIYLWSIHLAGSGCGQSRAQPSVRRGRQNLREWYPLYVQVAVRAVGSDPWYVWAAMRILSVYNNDIYRVCLRCFQRPHELVY